MQSTFSTLSEWLAHCEQIHPQNISMGLERVRVVAQRMQLKFDCPVITVAGTNGKGSTWCILKSAAAFMGKFPKPLNFCPILKR
jgi:dihydrofolate synthase/folylpolyglutamate synthase